VILAIAERIGVPEPHSRLIERYLAMPIESGPMRRGVALGLTMSRELIDPVLGAIELSARRAGAWTARMVDDIVLWSDDAAVIEHSFAALREAVTAFGFELQPAKLGAAAIGAPLPQSLPADPVRFNLLRLGPEGFAIDGDALERLRVETRAAMERAPSLLAAVRAYNTQARFVADSIAPHTDLPAEGGDHLAACAAAVDRFSDGVEAWLRSEIEGRCNLADPLPRAWLYWPVSAGGLGLRDVRLELATIPTERIERPDEPFEELGSAAWGAWYGKLISPCAPAPPRADAVSQAQVDDFIARGGELRGSTQEGLGLYWQWVLAVHGPEILERFGTFRFLLRKLVPLELLSAR
jgi:hypothetical protein